MGFAYQEKTKKQPTYKNTVVCGNCEAEYNPSTMLFDTKLCMPYVGHQEITNEPIICV